MRMLMTQVHAHCMRYRNRYRKDLAKHKLFVNKTALEWVQTQRAACTRILCLYA